MPMRMQTNDEKWYYKLKDPHRSVYSKTPHNLGKVIYEAEDEHPAPESIVLAEQTTPFIDTLFYKETPTTIAWSQDRYKRFVDTPKIYTFETASDEDKTIVSIEFGTESTVEHILMRSQHDQQVFCDALTRCREHIPVQLRPKFKVVTDTRYSSRYTNGYDAKYNTNYGTHYNNCDLNMLVCNERLEAELEWLMYVMKENGFELIVKYDTSSKSTVDGATHDSNDASDDYYKSKDPNRLSKLAKGKGTGKGKLKGKLKGKSLSQLTYNSSNTFVDNVYAMFTDGDMLTKFALVTVGLSVLVRIGIIAFMILKAVVVIVSAVALVAAGLALLYAIIND